ncbi:MAG: symmetrical bis(5'-nucleosyl)-tetraphosphatase [Burkholderiaceae bacterium]|nr:symmetrical bis(5'-nucleosyl)-tetraphosphatase [Burkholderiaceae bacterium]
MTGSSGPTIAIGDVQGCFDSLQELLGAIDDGATRLWFTGDLVNRGPESLRTLRWAIANEARLVTVLGNHDLHLLALAAGIRRPARSDTLDPVLSAPDAPELIDWLRSRPLAHLEDGHLLVHAGVLAQWSATRTVELAGEVQQALSGPGWADFLREMYGDAPSRWRDSLAGADRLRVIVNALTRLRYFNPEGEIDLACKTGPRDAPAGLIPWFDAPQRATGNVTVVFGHWSTLGLTIRPNLIGLDSGCVWGGELCAVRLSDRAVFRARCGQAAVPGPIAAAR